MIRRLYVALGKTITVIGYPLFWAYFRFSPSRRVRVLVVNEKQQILLLRGWLGFQKWTLPGGGCKRGETDQQAAQRELFEETGLKLGSAEFSLLEESKDPDLGHRTPLLMAKIASFQLEEPRGRAALEIIERKWWSQSQLPKVRSPLVDRALRHLRPEAN